MSYVTNWIGSLDAGTYEVTVPQQVTDLNGEVWNFKQWEDGSTLPTRVISLQSDTVLTATYEPQIVNYNLVVSSGAGGTTAPTPGTYPYLSGSSVQVMALADLNYRFLRWLLDSGFLSFSNPVTVLMNSDHVLVAEFEYIPPPPPNQSILMGVVSDQASGLPLEGASVTADGYSMVTGSDGKYSLTVELGAYTVTIAKQGYQTQTKTVDASTPVTIIMDIALQPVGTPPTPIDLTAAAPLILGAFMLMGKQK